MFPGAETELLQQQHMSGDQTWITSLCHHGNHHTSILHPELEDVDSGPSASGVKHDAVLVGRRRKGGPAVPGRRPALQAELRRPLTIELGGVSLTLDKRQVGEQQSHKDEDSGQLRDLHHDPFCAFISC